MYPAQWHTIFGNQTGESAQRILPRLIEMFGVGSVIEVGCGNAHWTRVAINAGVNDYKVIDGPWNIRAELLVDPAHFMEANLGNPLVLGRKYDLAVCLEVAEHVEAHSAAVLVESLANAADVVLFGAAIPLQGGHGHINEQWPSWWRTIFTAHGYRAFDLVRPQHWEDQAIHYWYRQNTFVYVRENNAGAMAAALREAPGPISLFDAVHPEKFFERASYQAIDFRKLVVRLPGWALGRIKSRLAGAG